MLVSSNDFSSENYHLQHQDLYDNCVANGNKGAILKDLKACTFPWKALCELLI